MMLRILTSNESIIPCSADFHCNDGINSMIPALSYHISMTFTSQLVVSLKGFSKLLVPELHEGIRRLRMRLFLLYVLIVSVISVSWATDTHGPPAPQDKRDGWSISSLESAGLSASKLQSM